jgi:NAD(P)-dependent dehydrogenase (short-subunit alcohol dehydrogenase family)
MTLPAAASSVITGAGSGFGRALAIELSARGGRLLISDVDEPGLAETERLARAAGAKDVTARRCDVTKLEEVEALAAACEGPVDLVVNNAGVSSGGRIGELPMKDWRWTLEVDLFGVIHGCHVFVPKLRAQRHGHVLNVASAAGLVSMPYMAAYNVAKAGVVALSETLEAELAGSGVGVTVLCPTFFQTNIVRSGRFVDADTKKRADKLMSRARPVEEVVQAALKSVDRGELYAVPMPDGRWLWRLKRAFPGSFGSLVMRGARAMKLDNPAP